MLLYIFHVIARTIARFAKHQIVCCGPLAFKPRFPVEPSFDQLDYVVRPFYFSFFVKSFIRLATRVLAHTTRGATARVKIMAATPKHNTDAIVAIVHSPTCARRTPVCTLLIRPQTLCTSTFIPRFFASVTH